MKRIVLLVAVAALASPLAALAARKPPKHAQKPTAQMTTKNAAWACKTLRTQDSAAFARAFGTNGTLRNAYGKCVSAHAHSAKLGRTTLSVHNVTITSTGSVTDAGSAGCQATAAGCTLTSSGTLNGVVGGVYTSTWTVLWKQATSNNAGGYCAPATGTTTLTLPALGTLTKDEKGTVCEVGQTGTNVEHVLKDGTFSISSGTGSFAGSSGGGMVSFDQKPGSSSALGGQVLGSEHFDELTLKL